MVGLVATVMILFGLQGSVILERPFVIALIAVPILIQSFAIFVLAYDELGLDDFALTDDELVDAMMAHPILINRPIVVGPEGTRLWRPSEEVLKVLDDPDIDLFTKEDAEVVRP